MSPISPELILSVMGIALLGVAALVGRPQSGASGLARIGRTPRLACAGAGLLCATAVLILSGSEDYGTQATPVRVTIDAELASDEVSEEIRVFLAGREVGVLRVDEQSPMSLIATTVAATGRHDYRLESMRQVKGRRPERATGTGEVVVGAKTPLGIFYNRRNGRVFLMAS